MAKCVLAVGNCSYDHGNLAAVIRKHCDAVVTAAGDADSAMDVLARGSWDLVLVNRILEADGRSGVELIRRIKSDASLAELPVMLVSNFPEAQQEAIEAGAEPGFGKRALDAPETIARLRAVLVPE